MDSVQLKPHEFEMAWDFGVQIYKESRRQTIEDAKCDPINTGVYLSCIGSVGERAVAKALGIYWPSAINNFHEPDLPFGIQVRCITKPHYRLKVTPHDHDFDRIVGIKIFKGYERKRLELPGWIYAEEGRKVGKRIDPHNQGKPFFAVALDDLREIDLLRGLIANDIVNYRRHDR